MTEEIVKRTIMGFCSSSSAGPDGLRPGHLKALLGSASAAAGVKLATALTNLINLVLEGGVPDEILPIFYGGSLCALTKPNGGVRPIAAGNTLRRLAVKVASEPLVDTLGEEFRPVQLGYGTKGGCEGTAHAARIYLENQTDSKVFFKIHVSNALNCLRRDIFLVRIREKVPSMYKLL